MKLRWTIVLVAINALLLWGIVQQFAYSTAERNFDKKVRAFLPLGGADWDSLSVSSAEGAWRSTRDRWGRWWVRSPFEWPAKAESIARMNGYLATLQIDSAFATNDLARVGQSLSSYGLDNPRAVLEVGNSSRSFSYKVGNVSPLGNKVYVLSPDAKEVWVVDAGLNDYLAYTAGSLRQGGFFPFNLVELEAVDVVRGDETLRYERKSGSSSWQLKTNELSLWLRAGAWDSWLTDLSAVAPSEHAKSDETLQALKTPYARINFQTLYGRRALIIGEIVESGTDRWAQWEGGRSAFVLSLDKLKIFRPDEFLDNRPLPFIPDEVTSLDWNAGDKQLALRRLEGGKWVISSADNTAADPDAVRVLLEQLCAVEAAPSLQNNPIEPTDEKLRMQTATQTVEVYLDRSQLIVKSARTAGRVLYSGGIWPTIPEQAKLADYRLFASVLPAPTGMIWHAGATTKRYEVNAPQTQGLTALLSVSPRAASWIKPEGELGEPNYRLEIVLSDRTVVVEFWRREGGLLGRAEGRTFTLLPAWVDFVETLVQLQS